MGSLYTSIIPNLLCEDVINALDKTNKEIMYVCNMVTQPGETDNFKVSNHIDVINKYLKMRKVDVVVSNNGDIDKNIALKYATEEQKDPVILDRDNIDIKIIENNYIKIEDAMIRHNVETLALDIFGYLIKN